MHTPTTGNRTADQTTSHAIFEQMQSALTAYPDFNPAALDQMYNLFLLDNGARLCRENLLFLAKALLLCLNEKQVRELNCLLSKAK